MIESAIDESSHQVYGGPQWRNDGSFVTRRK
jgi:hypothetical protein